MGLEQVQGRGPPPRRASRPLPLAAAPAAPTRRRACPTAPEPAASCWPPASARRVTLITHQGGHTAPHCEARLSARVRSMDTGDALGDTARACSMPLPTSCMTGARRHGARQAAPLQSAAADTPLAAPEPQHAPGACGSTRIGRMLTLYPGRGTARARAFHSRPGTAVKKRSLSGCALAAERAALGKRASSSACTPAAPPAPRASARYSPVRACACSGVTRRRAGAAALRAARRRRASGGRLHGGCGEPWAPLPAVRGAGPAQQGRGGRSHAGFPTRSRRAPSCTAG